jgi:hypothetical protein
MAELTSSLRNLKKRTEPRQNLLSGNLGITLGGQELVDVPGRSGFVYVRLLNNTSELIQAYNGIVSPIYNLPILVKRNKDRYEIYGRDTLRYQNWGTTPYLPIHGNQHSFDKTNGGGGDLVWVHQEQFYPLAVTPSGTYESPNVIVAPYLYNWYGEWHYYAGGGAPDCALAHPTGSSSTQVLLLCLDGDAGTLHYITGSVEAPHLITGSAGLFPHLPSYDPDTDIPLAAICITTGTTTIGWEEIYDVRQFFGREQTGGGTGSVSNHNSLTGLDGGTPGEYYHFTQLQYNDLTDGGETNLHYHTQTGSISGYVPNRVVISDGSGVVTTNNGFFYDGNLLILGHDSVPATYPGAFHVVAQDIGAVTDLWTYGDHAADSSYYVGHRARGTIDAPESIQDNDTMLFIRGRGFDGVWVGSRVGVTFVADESWVTGSANGTRIEFNATPVGSITMGTVATLYGDGVLNIPAGATYNIDGTPHTHVGLLPGIHNVLNSTYHGDVLTGNIARGDLLIGNSTPKIGQLAIGATPNSVLKSNGTDPSWSTYLLTGTSGGTTSFAVTNTKTLTFTSTGDFNLTVPATGTAALLATQNVFTVQQMIDGTADQIQLRVQAHSTQTTHILTLENSAATEQISFDVPTQNTAVLGAELITNGNFDADLSSWTTYGPISTVSVGNAGNGYNVGDVLTVVQTGGALGTLTVATLTGGAGSGVATVTLLAAGTGYTAANGLATTVAPAGGTLCTINVLTITGWAWNAAQNATRAVVAGTGAITQSINLTNNITYQVTITLVRTAGTLTETFGSMVGSYDFTSSQTVSKTFKATATAAFILTFTPTATFGGSIDSISVKSVTAGITSNQSINNTDGSYGIELRAGGIGLNNTFFGYRSGYSNTTGNYNSAQGMNALYYNTTGSLNSAQGYAALYYNTTGIQNSAQGTYALQTNTTGNYNSAQGVSALNSNTTGIQNSAQGMGALYSNTTGNYNSAQGVSALNSNTTGSQNSAQGMGALYSNTTGIQNSAQGYAALYNLKLTSKAITAFANYGATVAGTVKATSVGHGLTGTTTKEITGTVNYNGSKSVTVIDVDNFYFTATWVATETGWWSIVSEGRYNTGIGSNAGRTLTTADSCTFIGYAAGYHASQLATATNSTAIGNGAYTAASNQIVIGNASVTTFGIGTFNPTAHVQFTGVSDLIGLRVLGNATQTTNVLSLETSAAAVNISMDNSGGAIFNEQGNATGDFRIEGDTEPNLLFADYSADTIAFGGTGAAGATVSKGGHLTLPDINFSPSTPATLSGDVNDYDLGTNTWIRLSGGVADRIVTGIVARTDGHYMIITNVGATNKVSFSNESGSSAAANRIITAVAGTVELHPYESLFLLYDSASSRWREIIHA